jgi:hypothetical protein
MRRTFCCVLAVSVLVVAACGGGGKDKAKSTTTTEPIVTTTAAPPPPALLTGLPLEDRTKLNRPSLVVKIDNAPQARPQAGMDRADVVYEEVVEGGVVRFMAVFQSRDADLVGPVRSVRPVDPDIVTPLRGYFAYSGGAPQFVKLIKKAPVTLVGFDEYTKAYTKRSGRPAPHNLFTSTLKLYDSGKKASGPPPPLFTYGTPAGTPATHVTVVMGGQTKADWDWDASINSWRRTTNGTPHLMEGGNQLAFANVVVQYVQYSNTTSRDPAGFPVPTADVIGDGEAVVYAGANTIKAKWSKHSLTDVTTFTDATGVPVQLLPGPTWVMLAPIGAQTTSR